MTDAKDQTPERSDTQESKKTANEPRKLTRQELEILRRQLQKKFHRS